MIRKTFAHVVPPLCTSLCVMFATAAHAEPTNRHIAAKSVEDWKAFDQRYFHPERTTEAVQVMLTVYNLPEWQVHWSTTQYTFASFAECEQNLPYVYMTVFAKFMQDKSLETKSIAAEQFSTDNGKAVVMAWCGKPSAAADHGFTSDPAVPWKESQYVVDYANAHGIKVAPTPDWDSIARIVHRR
ncbi:hypothetical protein BTHE68_41140 [Burkholderia sp. THE68]|uniref:hypothetical protein n=1 Tax=Burkholderia sp. THE68 TaxID=758782 RepID=UPI0013190E2A|nr:hypothetical protein [Burkholderia sp. THE68]BBU30380.1 hypothetical protein BTHE68_41140 [Burkholderia sp. THE68]